MERFFGGHPVGVVLRLIVLSIVVGVVLAALNIEPVAILNGIRNLAVRIYDMGFAAVGWIFDYFLLGAVLVFPIWLIARLLNFGGKASDDRR